MAARHGQQLLAQHGTFAAVLWQLLAPVRAAIHDLRFGPRGHAIEFLNGLGRSYALYIRLVTLPMTIAVAVMASPTGVMRATAATTLAVLSCWSVVYILALQGRSVAWATAVDAVAIMIVGLCTQWLVAPEWLSSGKSWLIPFASCAIVGYQYSASCLVGGLAAGAVCGGAIIGTLVALPEGTSSPSVLTASWSLALAALARILWTATYLGGLRADTATAAAAEAERLLLDENERRADEEDLADLLHDHATTTLTWIGAGRITGLDAMYRERAQDDLLEVKAYAQDQVAATADLMALLRRRIKHQPLDVDLRVGAETLVLPIRVARAIADATSAALINVERHAKVGEASVYVDGDGNNVAVDITDRGIGFDRSVLRATARGVRISIEKRMEKIGGLARVNSILGHGTTVELRWANV